MQEDSSNLYSARARITNSHMVGAAAAPMKLLQLNWRCQSYSQLSWRACIRIYLLCLPSLPEALKPICLEAAGISGSPGPVASRHGSPRPRPQTSAAIARRLIGAALKTTSLRDQVCKLCHSHKMEASALKAQHGNMWPSVLLATNIHTLHLQFYMHFETMPSRAPFQVPSRFHTSSFQPYCMQNRLKSMTGFLCYLNIGSKATIMEIWRQLCFACGMGLPG